MNSLTFEELNAMSLKVLKKLAHERSGGYIKGDKERVINFILAEQIKL